MSENVKMAMLHLFSGSYAMVYLVCTTIYLVVGNLLNFVQPYYARKQRKSLQLFYDIVY